MLNCLIIDDEIAAIEVLEHFIEKTPQLNLIASTDNPVEGLSIVQREAIDLVFLDVQMPELSGIDFIKAINGKCKVILTTAYREYALEGYELDVIDYLMKPIPFSRFLKAVQKAVEMIPAKNIVKKPADQYDFILVKTETKGKFLKIDTADIDYIEGMDNYVAIFCGGKRTVAFINMKDLEEKLLKDKFMRVHKSFIVAIDRIVSIEGNSLLLKNNVQAGILIGNAYRPAFLEKMKSRLID